MKLTLQDREGHLALVSYCASSVLMTVFNKYVLSSLNYRKNFLLLFIQVSHI
jgi:GDP-mannose transporter